MQHNPYEKFAQYYDTYVQHFADDLSFYCDSIKGSKFVVEIGCGTGRILQTLLGSGANITGVDVSTEMLDIAKLRFADQLATEKLHLYIHNFLDAPMATHFDTALVTFFTFNYVLDDPQIFLSNLHDSMDDQGILIMDLFCPKPFRLPETDGQWSEMSFSTDGRTIKCRDRRTMNKEREIRTQIYLDGGDETEIITQRRYYAPQEIAALLFDSGWSDVQFSKSYSIDEFTTSINLDVEDSHFLVRAVANDI